MKSLKNYPRGFTLVELMIAVAILLAIVIGIISMFKSSLKDQVSARNESWAVDLMVEKMSNLRSADSLDTGTFFKTCTIGGDNEATLAWTIANGTAGDTPFEVTITTTWKEANQTNSKRMITFIKK